MSINLKYLSVGALALAQASLASAFDDFESDFADVAPAASVGDILEARATTSTSSSTKSAYPTSFKTIPTDNAAYQAQTAGEHSQFCATAASTHKFYSGACIDNSWGSVYGRSVVPEDESLEARAATTTSSRSSTRASSSSVISTTSSPAAVITTGWAVPTDNAGWQAMTHSQHLEYCATAQSTETYYTRACIQSIWESIYVRSAAPEEEASLMARDAEVTARALDFAEGGAEFAKTKSAEAAKVTKRAEDNKFYQIPADEAASQSFVASMDTKCNSSSAAYSYVCSVWGAQKPTLTTTTAAAAEKRDEEQLTTTIDAAAQPTATAENHWDHFNFNRNVYVSSLRTACPAATEEAVKEKCSVISSWYAEHSMVETAAPSVPTMIMARGPTTFMTVATRAVPAVEDEDVVDMEKRGKGWGGNAPAGNAPAGNAPSGNAPSGSKSKGEGWGSRGGKESAPEGRPEKPQGQAPQGQAPQGQAPQGQASQGQAPQDQAQAQAQTMGNSANGGNGGNADASGSGSASGTGNAGTGDNAHASGSTYE